MVQRNSKAHVFKFTNARGRTVRVKVLENTRQETGRQEGEKWCSDVETKSSWIILGIYFSKSTFLLLSDGPNLHSSWILLCNIDSRDRNLL